MKHYIIVKQDDNMFNVILQISIADLASLGRYMLPLEGGTVRFALGGIIEVEKSLCDYEKCSAILQLESMGFVDQNEHESAVLKKMEKL